MADGVNRATGTKASGRRWLFADCEYVELSRQLLVREQPVRLESKPLDVLQLLLERPGEVLTKDELIGAAWTTAMTDQSLATAISKLRKAFGGPRDAILLNVSGIGYRMAVPVACFTQTEPAEPVFVLRAGDPIPHREHWVAVRPLDLLEPHTVWLGEHKKTRAARVFKFATDGVRLRALQREVALARMLAQTLPEDERFVRIHEWNLEQLPFFLESDYGGQNLLEFARRDEFQQMPVEERVRLAAMACGAVAEAHGLGILHNDLKPGNVLLMPKASTGGSLAASWQVKVADFGVASIHSPQHLQALQITDHREFDTSNGGTTSQRGTAMYRPPEMTLPGATPSMRGDVYALGVMLYQIVCGDFLEQPTPGWETRIADPLLREDIAEATNIDVRLRLGSAAELADRLDTLAERRRTRARRQKELADAESNAQQAARARMRRPWIVLAGAALLAGLCTSLWFSRRADEQRDVALARSATLNAMNEFLATDLLAQTNPLAAPAGAGQVTQETLVSAIERILPQIDTRFAKDPEVAGQIHETLGAALDARSLFIQSNQQFQLAAVRFRQAEGPLSQNAILCELRGENALARSLRPVLFAQAVAGFQSQEALIHRLGTVTPELQAWEALAETGLQIYSKDTQRAPAELAAAVSRAEATPGFNPALLLKLKLRFCGIYLKLDRNAEVERLAREVIRFDTAHTGESPALIEPELYLEEALFGEGKYAEMIRQSDHDYAQFLRALGPRNQLTFSVLDMRAQAEEMMGQQDAALRDALALHASAATAPAAQFIASDSLNMAAQVACRLGDYAEGSRYARQLIQAAQSSTARQPYFVNVGSFALAGCLLGQAEADHGTRPATLQQVSHLLDGVNVPLVMQWPGMSGFSADVSLARARLDLLQGNRAAAATAAAQAAPVFSRPGTEPYEHATLARVQAALAHRS